MQRITSLVGSMWLALCVPLIAYANPQQASQADCKSLITHSGFAEYVVPSEGGTQKLPIKVSPSAEWRIHNGAYVEWIEILDGDTGAGPGTMTVQLAANPGNSCRVGVLTIVGVQSFYGNSMRIGLPIRILQQGSEAAAAKKEEQPKSSLPAIVFIPPFSNNNPQTPGKPQEKVYIKKN
jgi:hypothetical protein